MKRSTDFINISSSTVEDAGASKRKCVPVVLEEIANGENQDRDYFKMLPDEIMVYIFEHIDLIQRVKVEGVSRRWEFMARKSWLTVKRLTFDARSTYNGINILEQFSSFAHRSKETLVELRLKGFHSRLKFGHILKLLLKVEHIHFAATRVTSSIVNSLKYLSRLRSLSFESIDGNSTLALESYFTASNTLTFLRIPVTLCFQPPKKLPAQLEFLNIYTNELVWNVTYGYDKKSSQVEQIVETAASECPNMVILLLPDRIINQNIFDSLMLFKKLKFLRLNFATSLTSAFISFLDSFHALEGLMLDIINDKVVQAIVRNCPSLVHLTFLIEPSRKNILSIRELSSLPHLRSLSIGFLRQLNHRSPLSPLFVSSLCSIVDNGNLVHFNCAPDYAFDIDFLMELIKKCQSIESIACSLRQKVYSRYGEIFPLLETIISKRAKGKPKILHLNTYISPAKIAKLPKHPMVDYKSPTTSFSDTSFSESPTTKNFFKFANV